MIGCTALFVSLVAFRFVFTRTSLNTLPKHHCVHAVLPVLSFPLAAFLQQKGYSLSKEGRVFTFGPSFSHILTQYLSTFTLCELHLHFTVAQYQEQSWTWDLTVCEMIQKEANKISPGDVFTLCFVGLKFSSLFSENEKQGHGQIRQKQFVTKKWNIWLSEQRHL